MELTHEMANKALEEVREELKFGRTINAIKIIRNTFYLGLREANHYIQDYRHDLPALLRELKKHAGLTVDSSDPTKPPMRLFETAHFRLELKRPTELTLERLERFFDETLFDLKKDLKG